MVSNIVYIILNAIPPFSIDASTCACMLSRLSTTITKYFILGAILVFDIVDGKGVSNSCVGLLFS